MGNIIFIALFLLLIIITVKDLKKGIVTYIVISLVSPHLSINNIQISIEILAFFPVFFLFLINKPTVFLYFKKVIYNKLLVIFLSIYILSSIIAFFRFESNLPWISFFGIFRIIIVIIMLQYVMKDKPEIIADQILSPVILINLFVSIIQLTVPSSTELFYSFYYKDSLTPLKIVVSEGYFGRAYGTFGSPVLLGVFSLLSFTLYLALISEKINVQINIIKLIVSAVVGLFALSKTALLGIPLVIISYYLLNLFGFVRVKYRKIFFLPLILIPVIILLIVWLENIGTTITYYLKFFLNPLSAFSTRYDLSSGILAGTYSTIVSNWLIGVGGTPLGDDFFGDSMYISILYNTGIIGFFIYFTSIFGAVIKNYKLNHITSILIFIALILAGFAAPIQFDILSVLFIAYIFSETIKVDSISKN